MGTSQHCMAGNQNISFERLITMNPDDRRAQLNNMDLDLRIAFAEFTSTYVAPAEVDRLEAELAALTSQAVQQQRQLQTARTAGQQLQAQLAEMQSSISLVQRNIQEYTTKRASTKGEHTTLTEALAQQTSRIESDRLSHRAAEDRLTELISEAANMEQTRLAAEDRLNEARRPQACVFQRLANRNGKLWKQGQARSRGAR